MFLKRSSISKFAVIALSLITLSSSTSVFANENSNSDVNFNIEQNQEQSKADIEKITAKYGGEIKHDENKNLSEEMIRERFEYINSNYSVGEPFSDTDAEFVVNYALKETDNNNKATQSFNKTKTAYRDSVRKTRILHVKAILSRNCNVLSNFIYFVKKSI